MTPPNSVAVPRGPTFCAESIRQSSEGFDRLTLFRNGTLVWKTNQGGKEVLKRDTISPPELQYYCDFFGRAEFWSIPGDLRGPKALEFPVVTNPLRIEGPTTMLTSAPGLGVDVDWATVRRSAAPF